MILQLWSLSPTIINEWQHVILNKKNHLQKYWNWTKRSPLPLSDTINGLVSWEKSFKRLEWAGWVTSAVLHITSTYHAKFLAYFRTECQPVSWCFPRKAIHFVPVFPETTHLSIPLSLQGMNAVPLGRDTLGGTRRAWHGRFHPSPAPRAPQVRRALREHAWSSPDSSRTESNPGAGAALPLPP